MNARNMTDAELVHAVDCDGQASGREKELAARFAKAYPYAHGDAAAEQLEALADRAAGVEAALSGLGPGDVAHEPLAVVEAARRDLRRLADDLQMAADEGILSLRAGRGSSPSAPVRRS